jgi:hypothetical protein
MKKRPQLRKRIEIMIEENNFRPNVILETSSRQTCLRVITGNIACTFLPYIAAKAPTSETTAFCLEKRFYRGVM